MHVGADMGRLTGMTAHLGLSLDHGGKGLFRGTCGNGQGPGAGWWGSGRYGVPLDGLHCGTGDFGGNWLGNG